MGLMGLEHLISWDQAVSLAINRAHSEWGDVLMATLSAKWVWLPLYAVLVSALVVKWKRQAWKPLLIVALLITASDRISSGVLKPEVARERPCHDPEIGDVVRRLNGKCGGTFGFVSSHASNTFSLFLVGMLALRWSRWGWLVGFWAFGVGYSRVYLGVHYLGDVLGGWLVATLLSLLAAWAIRRWVPASLSPQGQTLPPTLSADK